MTTVDIQITKTTARTGGQQFVVDAHDNGRSSTRHARSGSTAGTPRS